MSVVLTGFGRLLRTALRHDRIMLPSWVLGIALGAAYCMSALELAFPDERDLVTLTAFMSGPAGRVLSGPGYGFDAPTHATVLSGVYALYLMLAVAAMSILLAVRHTRGEEESGRLELLRAGPVGRQTQLAVAGAVLAIADVAVALACWALLATSYDAASSALLAAGLAAVGLVLGTCALVTAQLVEHARTATALAFLVLGLAFVARAAGDVIGEHGSALSWLSPIAWSQQTRAFVADRWWPLAISLTTTLALAVGAAALQARRDVGAGLLPGRAGPAVASPALRGPLTLALRIERGPLVAWTSAAVLLGLAFGSLAQEVRTSLEGIDNPLVVEVLGGSGEALLNGYLVVCVLYCAMVVAAFAITTTHRLADEERSGRTEEALALPVRRTAWLGATAVVTLGGSLVGLVLSGLATGLGAAAVTGDWHLLGEIALATLTTFPALAVLAGVGLLGYAVRPGLGGIAWAVAGYGLLATMLGGALDLPDAAMDLAVFSHVGRVPTAETEARPLVVLSLVAAALVAAALWRFRRRDVSA